VLLLLEDDHFISASSIGSATCQSLRSCSSHASMDASLVATSAQHSHTPVYSVDRGSFVEESVRRLPEYLFFAPQWKRVVPDLHGSVAKISSSCDLITFLSFWRSLSCSRTGTAGPGAATHPKRAFQSRFLPHSSLPPRRTRTCHLARIPA